MTEKANQNDQNGSLGLSYTVYTGVTKLLSKAGRLEREVEVSTGYHKLGFASLQLKFTWKGRQQPRNEVGSLSQAKC